MEVGLLIGKQVAGVAKPEASLAGVGVGGRKAGLLDSVRLGPGTSRVGFSGPTRKGAAVRLARRAAVRSEMAVKEKDQSTRLDKIGPVRLFVGLPLDAVSYGNSLNYAKAIATGLRALKLLGVDGVELPVSWGVVADAGGDWSSYLTLATMARDAGLSLRVSLHLHSSYCPRLPLPRSVSAAAATDPDLLFADRSDRRHADCLSFAVDDLPVLGGRTPMEVYEEFFRNFRDAFSDFIGSTVTDITIGLGPNGELRYPSFPPNAGKSFTGGVGEFQCYDKYMLADLKKRAEESGNPLWGLSGPHDAPEYNQPPSGFFKEQGGSWETPYGQFFLSWYSGKLLVHGDRMLSVAATVFGDLPVTMSGKVPFLHRWHNTRSRPSQLTAGFFNTDGRDGYDPVAEMFAKNSCTMIIPSMDEGQQPDVQSSNPDALLSQIKGACQKHGVRLAGENSALVGAGKAGFSRIKQNALAEDTRLDSFTYHRMGAEFFSPEHWPLFTEFVRSVAQPEIHADDLPSKTETSNLLVHPTKPGNDREMQAA